MDDNQQIVYSLRSKIQELISMYNNLKAENEYEKKEIVRLNEQIKINEAEIATLQEKYDTLKVAKSILASSEDSHDAKLKVNKIVRDIDKCIALLNR
ncbi:MAG: hypothetical protein Q8907_04770 [Bacteroidota bacterium]|nr:hypothetical protein [Bacteroidota bacterium]MDP4226800.1 hypothetical protein [Bacteroidota bacterium]MDP4273574.1 hypothetical protein [Bacteroidota bacterium]